MKAKPNIISSTTMKALLAFSFFLLALFSFTGAEFIEDSNGNRLSNGGTYYIKPLGFFLSIKATSINPSTRSSSCSLAIVQTLSLDDGWPTKITATYPTKFITNDYPLNITFARLPSNACTNTPDWVVTKIQNVDGAPVMVGKFEEFTSFSMPVSGYFYIQPDTSLKGYYKFAFCRDKATCGYVILKTDEKGNQRVTVSSDRSKKPLLVKFDKATSTSDEDSGIAMVV